MILAPALLAEMSDLDKYRDEFARLMQAKFFDDMMRGPVSELVPVESPRCHCLGYHRFSCCHALVCT
jgi:hypothetical protein